MARTKAFDEQETLRKAMTLFWKKGFHATSMQDLVETLGINRASLYDTYGDKETLYRKAVILYQEINQAHMQRFLYRHPDVTDGFRAFFLETIEQSLSDPDHKGCFMVNTTTEMASQRPEFSDLVRRNQEAVEQLFIDYLAMGVTSGQLPSSLNAQATAAFFYSVNAGLMVMAKVTDSREKLLEVVTTALQVLS